MAPVFAGALSRRTAYYVETGRTDEPYEEAVRDLLLSDLGDDVGAVDISGLAWIEIDFPADVTRARTEILPRIRRETARYTQFD